MAQHKKNYYAGTKNVIHERVEFSELKCAQGKDISGWLSAAIFSLKSLLIIFIISDKYTTFTCAVPSDSGDFQMPTCPSASASTLRRGRANFRNASVTFIFGIALILG